MLQIPVFLMIAWLVGYGASAFMETGEPYLELALNNIYGRTITLFIFAVWLIILISIFLHRDIRNTADDEDEHGMALMEKGTFGRSRWMTEAEMEKYYTVARIEDTHETVYGQLDDGRVVANKIKTTGGTGGLSNLIIGSIGSGKSYSFVRTELIQTILRGESLICTDPSGELYRSMSQFCRNRGVDIRVLNLSDPEYSDFWDCLAEVKDPTTERLDSSRLNSFVSVYIENSSDGKEDDFWKGSSTNLLKAAIGACSWKRETRLLKDYMDLYSAVSAGLPESLDTVIQFKGMVSFGWCKQKIYEAAEKKNIAKEEIDEKLRKIEREAPIFSISEVVYTLMYWDEVIGKETSTMLPAIFASMPKKYAGRMAYEIYKKNRKEDVAASAAQGILMKLQCFTDERMRDVLSHEGINLRSINEKQSAYFVITKDTSNENMAIASLFFSFFFMDAQATYDKAQALIEDEGKGAANPRLPVTVMLDEFFSLGVIGGDEAAFTTVMSNGRKRQLHVSIIIQNITQIAQRYGEYNARTIQSCCDTLIYLGGNDPDTLEFISSFASGETTVMTESHSETSSVIRGAEDTVRVSAGSRYLMTKNDAHLWMDKIMVVRRGRHPMQLQPFPYTLHPCYANGEMPPSSVYKSVIPLSVRMTDKNITPDSFNKDEIRIQANADEIVDFDDLPDFAMAEGKLDHSAAAEEVKKTKPRRRNPKVKKKKPSVVQASFTESELNG